MGRFDFLLGRRGRTISGPEQLRQLLFTVAAGGDFEQLVGLCRQHASLVAEHFARWQILPDPLLTDPIAAQSYGQNLVTIANAFAYRLGHPELLQCLMGTEVTNPLLRWQNRLEEARLDMTHLCYRDARDLLCNLLIDTRDLHGGSFDTLRPITLGLLGESYFQNGEAAQAVPHMEEALRLCEASGDADGIAAYRSNLVEVHRYLGQSAVAADHAECLADVLQAQGQSTEAVRYRRRAAIMRAGEPLNRVVAIVDAASCELEDLCDFEGKRIQLAFERNRLTLRLAEGLVSRGLVLGSERKYPEALARFQEAAAADPFDPHAHYQTAYALLHLGRYWEAIEEYSATEERAPGWYRCRTEEWLARELASGRLGPETGVAVLVLEDSGRPARKQVDQVEWILAQAPELAPAHLLHGRALAQLQRETQARDAFRKGLACAAEPDVRSRLLVELAVQTVDPAERESLWQQALAPGGNLIAAAQATLALRAQGTTG